MYFEPNERPITQPMQAEEESVTSSKIREFKNSVAQKSRPQDVKDDVISPTEKAKIKNKNSKEKETEAAKRATGKTKPKMAASGSDKKRRGATKKGDNDISPEDFAQKFKELDMQVFGKKFEECDSTQHMNMKLNELIKAQNRDSKAQKTEQKKELEKMATKCKELTKKLEQTKRDLHELLEKSIADSAGDL